jgi:50S ribosomal protein L16 3-hydroxylase
MHAFMLDEWLAPDSVVEFVDRYFGHLPHARPGLAARVMPWFDWTVLGRVLAERPPDMLVASHGRLVKVPPPRDLSDVRQLMDAKLGLVIRQSEHHDSQLAQLARAFARDLQGEVHVQLYVTPAGSQTFGWHYDFEDVFIAQTVGAKDYHFCENTVARDTPVGTQPDFSYVRRETSPILSAHLLPGDWLYIPRRWWHLVRSVEDSLSISIGVLPAGDQAHRVERPAASSRRDAGRAS